MARILVAVQNSRYPSTLGVAVRRAVHGEGYEVVPISGFDGIEAEIHRACISGDRFEAAVLVESDFSFDVSGLSVVAANIRDLPDNCCFDAQIRAKTLPIVMVMPPSDFGCWERGVFSQFRWSTTVSRAEDVQRGIEEVARTWREDLKKEFAYLGFALTRSEDGLWHVGHAIRRCNREGEILAAEATPLKLRKKKCSILPADVLQDGQVLREFEFLLNCYQGIAKKRGSKEEEIFQEFFDRNPHLIYRSEFARHWPKPRIDIPSPLPNEPDNYQPDFVLEPIMAPYLGTNWEVMDLKRPNDKLLVSRFHRGLSARLVRYLKQLRNYRKVFSRRDVEPQLVQLFGMQPANPRLAIVIGRRPHQDDQALLAEELAEYPEVRLMTYDDLFTREVYRIWGDWKLACF